jgi:ataxin-3
LAFIDQIENLFFIHRPVSHTSFFFIHFSSKDYLNRISEGSGNVDPSGNFSIEVLRAALNAKYGLELPSLLQEGVAAFGDVTDMEGFICNREAHWFAIRKVNGRFWNLNSMAERPEIISHFQLATEIQGWQNSGYSVFCVPNSLPPPCSSKAQRSVGLPQYWWKEDDLVQGKGRNAVTGATDPWRDVGSGMRLDGQHTSNNLNMNDLGDLTEDEMMQMALAASLAPPMTTKEERVELTPEPAAGAGTVRMQFRLPSGGRAVRRFLAADSVKMVYAFVEKEAKDGQGRRLELRCGFPPKDLQPASHKTIGEASLAGESIQCIWV